MSFKRFRRILVRLLTVVVILATAGSIGLYGYRAVFGYHYDSSLSDEDLSAGIQADENITNIALFGLDTRPGDEKSHSDCMMIVTIDNTRGKIKLSSLMRDSLVEIDGVGEDKLNAAYFRGGPSLAIRTINENFGTDIEDYIAVNFEQVVEIVDALDGIEINVASEAELTELNRVIRDYGLEQGKEFSPVEKTGLQTLDGVQALCYGRIRKGNTGDDWSRVERQSVVLNAMFDGRKRPARHHEPTHALRHDLARSGGHCAPDRRRGQERRPRCGARPFSARRRMEVLRLVQRIHYV